MIGGLKSSLKLFLAFTLSLGLIFVSNLSVAYADVALTSATDVTSTDIQPAMITNVSQDSNSDAFSPQVDQANTSSHFDSRSPVRLARISTNNGSEFIQVGNFSDNDLSIKSLTLKLFNSKNSAVGEFSLPAGIFAKQGFIVLDASGKDFTKKLPDEAIPGTSGGVQLFVNDELADEICWGSSTICTEPYALPNMPSIPTASGLASQKILQSVLIAPILPSSPSGNQNFSLVSPVDQLGKPLELKSGGFTATTTTNDGSGGPAMDPPTTKQPTNLCSGLIINEIAANNNQQFIELKNSSSSAINVLGCQLQTNRSETAIFSLGNVTLAPGAFLVVKISDTDLTLTKTTSGKVYLLSSDGQTEINEIDYANLKPDTSFASFDDGWKQTYAVTPGVENVYEQFLPCADGYERSLTTGNCNKIAAAAVPKICDVGYFLNEQTNRCNKNPIADSLTPCATGSVRNIETNRCNKITQPTALIPCDVGSVRNPETNRCRKLATATEPTLCQAGWERNPDTHRCRKIASAATANYPVKVSKNSSTENNLVLIAGAILVGTLLLITWQFREEISRLAQQLRTKILAKKYYNEMSQCLKNLDE